MKNILLVGALMEQYFIGWSGKIVVASLKYNLYYCVLSYSVPHPPPTQICRTTFYIFSCLKIISQLDGQAILFIW